jgi:hypothetical protein
VDQIFLLFFKFSAPKNPFFSFPKHQKEGIVKEKTAWLVILLKKKNQLCQKKKLIFSPHRTWISVPTEALLNVL